MDGFTSNKIRGADQANNFFKALHIAGTKKRNQDVFVDMCVHAHALCVYVFRLRFDSVVHGARQGHSVPFKVVSHSIIHEGERIGIQRLGG